MDPKEDFHFSTNDPFHGIAPGTDSPGQAPAEKAAEAAAESELTGDVSGPRGPRTLRERLAAMRSVFLRTARHRVQRGELGRVSGQNEEKKRQQRNFALLAAGAFCLILAFVWLGSGSLGRKGTEPEVRFAKTDFRVGPDSLDKQAFQSQYEERLDAISTQLKGTNDTIGKLTARINELNAKREGRGGSAAPGGESIPPAARLPDFPDASGAALAVPEARKPQRARLGVIEVAARAPAEETPGASAARPFRRGLKGGWDEPIARNRARHESARSYIPAGSFMRGAVLSGVTAPTGGNAAQNPIPMLLEVTNLAQLPNEFRASVKRCFVTANAAGDLSSERVWVRLDRMSCMRADGKALDVRVQGYVTGDDGKTGVRARLVTRSGQAIANALFLGTLSGLGKAVSLSAQNTTTYSSGAQSSNVTNPWRAGLGEGVDTASERIISYYLKLADKIFPVLEIDSGRKVDIVFSQGVTLGEDPPQKPKAAPVQDIPGANSSLVFGRAMKERNNEME